MKGKPDVNEAIRENVRTVADAAELGRIARLLDEELSPLVSARPAFREQLRAQLMEEARRTLGPTPGRTDRRTRPRFFTWGLGVVAAAAAVGAIAILSFSRPGGPTRQIAVPDAGSGPSTPPAGGAQDAPAADAPDLPNVQLEWPGTGVQWHKAGYTFPAPSITATDAGMRVPDEVLASGQTVPTQFTLRLTAGQELPTTATIYRVSLQGERVTRQMAAALGLPAPAADGAGNLTSSSECATLTMSVAEVIEYRNLCAMPNQSGEPLSAESAGAVALKFRRDAAAAASAMSPPDRVRQAAFEGVEQAYWAEWDIRLGDATLRLAAPDTVVLSPDGQVLYARLVPVEPAPGPDRLPLRTPEEAVKMLQQKGYRLPGTEPYRITITAVELVYGMPESGHEPERIAQPFWRLSGTSEQGYAFTGYVPAVAEED